MIEYSVGRRSHPGKKSTSQREESLTEESLRVNRGNNCWSWLCEGVFDPDRLVNQVSVREEGDLVLRYCISPLPESKGNVEDLVNTQRSERTSAVIRSSGTACSMDTVVVTRIVEAADDKGVSADRSPTEFLENIISILSFNL